MTVQKKCKENAVNFFLQVLDEQSAINKPNNAKTNERSDSALFGDKTIVEVISLAFVIENHYIKINAK